MNSSTANTKPDGSPKPRTAEYVAHLSKRNEELADLEVARIIEGMNRLRQEKRAAQGPRAETAGESGFPAG